MYLSERFLKTLNENYTNTSIKNALDICNHEFCQRYGTFDNEELLNQIFFTTQSDSYKVTTTFIELMDFWNTYVEFDKQLPPEEKRKYDILQILYDVDGLYQFYENQRLLATLTLAQNYRLQKLCNQMEHIPNAKVIKFFRKCDAEFYPKYEITMEDFEEALSSYNYLAIQNHLIEALSEDLQAETLIVIIAGSKGLTPRRLYGCLLKNGDWSNYPPQDLYSFSSIILTENSLAIRNGTLKGIN